MTPISASAITQTPTVPAERARKKISFFYALALLILYNSIAHATESRQATLTEAGHNSIHQYAPLGNDVKRDPGFPGDRLTRQTASLNGDILVYDVTIEPTNDYDGDGHYSTFNVSLDVDTIFRTSTVYAVLYLSHDGGAWSEYAVTGDFTISGSGPVDRYTLTATLDSGYPSGYYDHFVEIYDAHTHALVGSYGAGNSHAQLEFSFESTYHDSYYDDNGSGFGTSVSVRFSGTGSTGIPSIIALLLVIAIRRIR